MPFFGSAPPPPDPKEMVREWKRKIGHEQRGLDRQILSIEREELKVKIALKDAAKKNQLDVCKVLAKSLVQSRKAKNRIHASKAHMNSVCMQMQNQLSTIRMAGAIQKSTAVMQSMGALVNVPEVQATMRELSIEMTKAGLIEEMMDDSMATLDDDDLEEAADVEVNAVLFELTKGAMGAAPDAVTDAMPAPAAAAAAADADDEILTRLQALRT